MKELIKKIIKAIPYDFTLNQKYDTQTKKIIKKVLRSTANCVDVGCHKGEVLDIIRAASPEGKHFGFEPIPMLCDKLKAKYQGTNCEIIDVALSNVKGTATFNYVVSNPSYSGLKKRQYDKPNEIDTTIEVKTNLLDNIIPENIKIDLIKIDVEGGELLVLEGATALLKRCRPVVVFEHGLGASDFYGSTPDKIFQLFESCGMNISLMERYIKAEKPFTASEFEEQYYKKLNYYFIAYFS